jgi:hypothetical protein
MEDDQDIPTQAEQALYLVTELSWLMDRTSPEDWPQHRPIYSGGDCEK